MRRLVFSPAARRDLAGIAAYIAEAAGRTIAAEVVVRLRSRCELIATTPGVVGTARPEIREGIRCLPVPPHVLFFRYSDSEVQIVRVLHERQDVERTMS